MTVDDAGDFAGRRAAIERIEFPEAGIGESQAEDIVAERAFVEKAGRGIRAVGLAIKAIVAARAAMDENASAKWLDREIVGIVPAIAHGRIVRAGAGTIGASPDKIDADAR